MSAREVIGSWYETARQVLRGGYLRMLETQLAREREAAERQREENATLRAENRALLNSLLGTVGVPPIEKLIANPVQIAPIRRRSWNQIAKAREVESARKPVSSTPRKREAEPPV